MPDNEQVGRKSYAENQNSCRRGWEQRKEREKREKKNSDPIKMQKTKNETAWAPALKKTF